MWPAWWRAPPTPCCAMPTSLLTPKAEVFFSAHSRLRFPSQLDSELVERNLQVHHTVIFGGGQVARPHIHLDRR